MHISAQITASPCLKVHCVGKGDKRTAQDAYLFIEGFLQRFPKYKGRPLWLAGESYGACMLLCYS